MDSDIRKQIVLKTLVETYVHTNQPVGSMQVAEQLPYEVSSATIRNDMAEMEALGLLTQPHTSAGRIPTDLGYRHYVKMLTKERKELSRKQQEVLSRYLNQMKNLQDKYKMAAKLLAEMSGSIGMLMDDARNTYIHGFSNVAKLPEFSSDENFRINMMQALESPEELVNRMEDLSGETNVMIGDNPAINNATIVISNFGSDGKKRVISIIGPTRMEYRKALPLVEYMKRLLKDL